MNQQSRQNHAHAPLYLIAHRKHRRCEDQPPRVFFPVLVRQKGSCHERKRKGIRIKNRRVHIEGQEQGADKHHQKCRPAPIKLLSQKKCKHHSQQNQKYVQQNPESNIGAQTSKHLKKGRQEHTDCHVIGICGKVPVAVIRKSSVLHDFHGSLVHRTEVPARIHLQLHSCVQKSGCHQNQQNAGKNPPKPSGIPKPLGKPDIQECCGQKKDQQKQRQKTYFFALIHINRHRKPQCYPDYGKDARKQENQALLYLFFHNSSFIF